MKFRLSAVVLLAGGALLVSAFGSQSDVLELEFREGTDMEAVPSPDGRLMALQLWQHIWIMDVESGEARRLTDPITPPDEHWFPRWSPDGRSIVFSSLRTDAGLFVVPAAGGDPRQLTDGEFDFWPSWSPDGDTIVFAPGRLGGLWTVPVGGGTPERLTPDSLNASAPAWSPDGRWIAFVSQGHLSVMTPDAETVREVTTGDGDQAPSWSEDGQDLFFLSDRSGSRQVWSVPVEGGEPRQLTDEADVYSLGPHWMVGRNVLVYTAGGKIRTLDPNSGVRDMIPFQARLTLPRESYERKRPEIPRPGARLPVRGISRPVPSPDGARMAFAALGDLWLRHPDGHVEQLTSGPGDDLDPAWSPDGQRLTFVSNRRGDYHVWVLNLGDGTARQVATTPGHAETPLWHPSGESIVFSGGSRPNFRMTLMVVPASGGTPQPMTETTGQLARPLGWLPDDQSLVYSDWYRDRATNELGTAIHQVRIDGASVPIGTNLPEQVPFAALSPTGETLAYISHGELWTRPLGAETLGRRLAAGPAFFPAWSESDQLVYVNGGKLIQVDASTGEIQQLSLDLSYEVPHTDSMLVRNARLLTPAPREGLWDLLLEEGRITSIEPSAGASQEADQIVDVEGRTVIPGLSNLHAHMYRGFRVEGYLYGGVTSVGGAGAEGLWLIQLQEAIQSGRRPGPRIFPAGGFVIPSRAGGSPQFLRVKTEEQLEGYVNHLRGLGATQVKSYLRRDPWLEAATVRAAHRAGLPVLSHFLQPAAVAAGLDRKEHAAYFNFPGGEATQTYQQDVIEILRQANITLDPTLLTGFASTVDGRARLTAALEKPDASSFFFLAPAGMAFLRSYLARPAQDERRLDATMANVAKAHAAGVRIVVGTDLTPLVGYLGVHWELELLVKAGLSPLEALRAATTNAAATLGVEDQLGSIAPGMIADLVVLDADPLEDIRNTLKIHAVIKDGKLIDRDALLADRQN